MPTAIVYKNLWRSYNEVSGFILYYHYYSIYCINKHSAKFLFPTSTDCHVPLYHNSHTVKIII